eukprot:507572_1
MDQLKNINTNHSNSASSTIQSAIDELSAIKTNKNTSTSNTTTNTASSSASANPTLSSIDSTLNALDNQFPFSSEHGARRHSSNLTQSTATQAKNAELARTLGSFGATPGLNNPLSPSGLNSHPYNPLTHWGNVSSLRNPYQNYGAPRNATKSSVANPKDSNNPRKKSYEDKMDKQRLEHILFSGDQSGPLNQQKERMRQKLQKKQAKANKKTKPKHKKTQSLPNASSNTHGLLQLDAAKKQKANGDNGYFLTEITSSKSTKTPTNHSTTSNPNKKKKNRGNQRRGHGTKLRQIKKKQSRNTKALKKKKKAAQQAKKKGQNSQPKQEGIVQTKLDECNQAFGEQSKQPNHKDYADQLPGDILNNQPDVFEQEPDEYFQQHDIAPIMQNKLKLEMNQQIQGISIWRDKKELEPLLNNGGYSNDYTAQHKNENPNLLSPNTTHNLSDDEEDDPFVDNFVNVGDSDNENEGDVHIKNVSSNSNDSDAMGMEIFIDANERELIENENAEPGSVPQSNEYQYEGVNSNVDLIKYQDSLRHNADTDEEERERRNSTVLDRSHTAQVDGGFDVNCEDEEKHIEAPAKDNPIVFDAQGVNRSKEVQFVEENSDHERDLFENMKVKQESNTTSNEERNESEGAANGEELHHALDKVLKAAGKKQNGKQEEEREKEVEDVSKSASSNVAATWVKIKGHVQGEGAKKRNEKKSDRKGKKKKKNTANDGKMKKHKQMPKAEKKRKKQKQKHNKEPQDVEQKEDGEVTAQQKEEDTNKVEKKQTPQNKVKQTNKKKEKDKSNEKKRKKRAKKKKNNKTKQKTQDQTHAPQGEMNENASHQKEEQTTGSDEDTTTIDSSSNAPSTQDPNAPSTQDPNADETQDDGGWIIKGNKNKNNKNTKRNNRKSNNATVASPTSKDNNVSTPMSSKSSASKKSSFGYSDSMEVKPNKSDSDNKQKESKKKAKKHHKESKKPQIKKSKSINVSTDNHYSKSSNRLKNRKERRSNNRVNRQKSDPSLNKYPSSTIVVPSRHSKTIHTSMILPKTTNQASSVPLTKHNYPPLKSHNKKVHFADRGKGKPKPNINVNLSVLPGPSTPTSTTPQLKIESVSNTTTPHSDGGDHRSHPRPTRPPITRLTTNPSNNTPTNRDKKENTLPNTGLINSQSDHKQQQQQPPQTQQQQQQHPPLLTQRSAPLTGMRDMQHTIDIGYDISPTNSCNENNDSLNLNNHGLPPLPQPPANNSLIASNGANPTHMALYVDESGNLHETPLTLPDIFPAGLAPTSIPNVLGPLGAVSLPNTDANIVNNTENGDTHTPTGPMPGLSVINVAGLAPPPQPSALGLTSFLPSLAGLPPLPGGVPNVTGLPSLAPLNTIPHTIPILLPMPQFTPEQMANLNKLNMIPKPPTAVLQPQTTNTSTTTKTALTPIVASFTPRASKSKKLEDIKEEDEEHETMDSTPNIIAQTLEDDKDRKETEIEDKKKEKAEVRDEDEEKAHHTTDTRGKKKKKKKKKDKDCSVSVIAHVSPKSEKECLETFKNDLIEDEREDEWIEIANLDSAMYPATLWCLHVNKWSAHPQCSLKKLQQSMASALLSS